MKIAALLLCVSACGGAQDTYTALSQVTQLIVAKELDLRRTPAALAALPAGFGGPGRAVDSLERRLGILEKAVADCASLSQALIDADRAVSAILADPPTTNSAPIDQARTRLVAEMQSDYAASAMAPSDAERRNLAGEIRRIMHLIHWLDIERAEQKTRRSTETIAEKPRLQAIEVALRMSESRVDQLKERLEFALDVDREAAREAARTLGPAIPATGPVLYWDRFGQPVRTAKEPYVEQ